MSVYKELFYAVKEVAVNSKRIYDDACDFGAPIKSKNDDLVRLIKGIIDQYDGTVDTVKYATGATQTITVHGLDEWTTGNEVLVNFICVLTPKRKDMIGFIYVTVDGIVQPT